MNWAALGVMAALASLVAACNEPEDERETLLRSWGETVLMPAYHDFQSASRSLRTASEAFCQVPDEAGLAAAQAAWWAARRPWEEAAVFWFGPYIQEPLRLGPQIDFRPAREDSIRAVLEGTGELSVDAADGWVSASKGLPAVELLLFEPEVDLVASFESDPRRCQYLVAVTADLEVRAGELLAAWDPDAHGYYEQLLQPGGDSAYTSLQAALGEVLNRMAFVVEDMRRDRLGGPVGDQTGTPDPGSAVSRFSGRSLEDLRDQLTGLETLYWGVGARWGLEDLLGPDHLALHTAFRTELAECRAALQAIPEPLTEAVLADRAVVLSAIAQLSDLQRVIQVDVLNALSLTVTFSDSDGD